MWSTMRSTLVLSAGISAVLADTYCKPVPSSADWPDQAAWSGLNQSVAGKLYATVPPGAVCHPSLPQYNPNKCEEVATLWTNTLYHANDSVSVDYNDNTCFPNATYPCSAAGYPVYSLKARNASDVQAAVKFAYDTGIRLVIKGTGHNYPSRSSGPDSLLINTHHLRGMTYYPGDPAAVKLGAIGSVKIPAGEQIRDLYAFAAAHNITLVGGADPDVGIGGWLSGAGHSPLSSRFGLGADQAIEMEVVTADGQLHTINADCEPDLFWALRGGGGGTFAVLISVTVKAHPAFPLSYAEFSVNTTTNSDTFWSMSTYMNAQMPHLSESGLMGYYYVVPTDYLNGQGSGPSIGTFYALFLAPTLSRAQLTSILDPLVKKLNGTSWGDPIVAGANVFHEPSFASWWLQYNPPEPAGYTGRLGSRLVGNSSLTGDFDRLRDLLRASTPGDQELLGNLVAGPGVRSPPGGIAGGSNAVLPAWRDAYSHLILPRFWNPLNLTAQANITTQLRDVDTEALRQLAPDSGAYLNEADPTEPNWQQTFFGANYQRLLSIKQSYDPKGVFWCKSCVGSELWDAEGPFGVENGVGQNAVRLCQTRS